MILDDDVVSTKKIKKLDWLKTVGRNLVNLNSKPYK